MICYLQLGNLIVETHSPPPPRQKKKSIVLINLVAIVDSNVNQIKEI